jgi:hypothetical protein
MAKPHFSFIDCSRQGTYQKTAFLYRFSNSLYPQRLILHYIPLCHSIDVPVPSPEDYRNVDDSTVEHRSQHATRSTCIQRGGAFLATWGEEYHGPSFSHSDSRQEQMLKRKTRPMMKRNHMERAASCFQLIYNSSSTKS